MHHLTKGPRAITRAMAYEIYARKYRPKTFDDLIGQEPIAQALREAVARDRTAGVYVFSGLHGIGKTSAARIFAKALNCPRVKGGNPCGACRVCKSIARGSCLDVIEIDAASNSRVEDVRELRDGFAYQPVECRFRVFILDEAHRLSTAAFDALLKVFEESVDTTRFVLATTELHKLPPTILSRGQAFRFRPANTDDVMRALNRIKTGEKLAITKEALKAVAHRAAGSLRDAQKYLDQVVSLSTGKTIKSADVAFLFGTARRDLLSQCIVGFVEGNAGPVIDAVHKHVADGGRADTLAADLTEAFRGALYYRACGPDTPLLADVLLSTQELEPLVNKFSPQELLQILASLQEMQVSLRNARDARLHVETALVRVALGLCYALPQVVEQAPAPPKKVDYVYPAEFLSG